MAAELDEQIGAVFERAEHVEVGDAAAGAVRDVAVDRQHDRRLVIRVHELRRGDADDAAMPALAADDEDVVGADRRVGLDRLLRLRDELRLFLLASQVLVVQLLGQRRALRRPCASSVASSSRAAMSGVLMRPAALTRGASMKPTW